MSLIAQKLISASGATEETDDDFNLVTALYHFDTTTDNGNNSTFLDSSSESHTVTPGSTPPTQGSFSPFSAEEGKWSVSFDGTNDYLTIPDSTDFDFGSGEFTVEAWVHGADSGSATGSVVYNQSVGGGTSNSAVFFGAGTSGVSLYISTSGSSWTGPNQVASVTVDDDAWHHLVWQRRGDLLEIYVDGTQAASTSFSGTIYNSSRSVEIGTQNGGSDFKGFISNLRVVKGSAVYSSNFTPPTAPSTAITNTKLLICCSNRLRDKSTSAHAITAVNNASIKPFSPFNPLEAYSASVKGGSANFFQLATSKLDVTDASDFDFGTGDFTVEAWVYPTKDLIGGSYPFALMLNGKGSNFYMGWTTYSTAGLVIYGDGLGSIYSGSTDHVPQKYAWSHIVYQNTSGNFNFYLNGTRVCNVSNSGSFPDVTGVTVGVNDFYGSYYTGAHVSDLRVVKGSNVYSNASTLTVPTAPLTSVTNTKLLLNFTNSVFFDSTGKTNARFLSGSGVVRSKTGVKKFGTASAQWTGTGAYLRLNQSLEPDLIPVGGGDFTIEFQLRLTDVTSTQVFIDFRHNSVSNIAPVIYISGGFKFYAGTSEITIGTLSTNTWHHIALVRNGSTITSYIDGTAGGTESNTNDLTTEMLTIGGNYNGDYYLRGYMDELRITVGKARYTSNFTAPTEEFPNL